MGCVDRLLVVVGWSALAMGCGQGPAHECSPYDQVFAYVDGDGDGFGSGSVVGYVCELGENQSTHNVDCDDTDPLAYPGRDELCDQVDNDCNGLIDDGFPKTAWFRDVDGDSYGDPADVLHACLPPGADYVRIAGDCADDDPSRNPEALEICNGGVDDDCDGRADDRDASVSEESRRPFYRDRDRDGFGSPLVVIRRCDASAGFLPNSSDCDDFDATINPLGLEVCDRVDNNCDGTLDDADPTFADFASLKDFACDDDGDGFGAAGTLCQSCFPTPGIGVDNELDCDDGDRLANLPQDWLADADKDVVGAGKALHFQCLNPGDGSAPESQGVDCDDDNGDLFPGNHERCGDGLDQDCNDLDCGSCLEWLADDAGASSGVYPIDVGTQYVDLFCDMATDGGGWTLVSSALEAAVDDLGEGYHDDLVTLAPDAPHAGVYDGLRSFIVADADLRFACKDDVANAVMTVDLSLYDVPWYRTITLGTTDGSSCFAAAGGTVGDVDPAPGRRNNLNGVRKLTGDDWNAGGGLEGEDACNSVDDFAIDFDDRGVAGLAVDSTDWGESNGDHRCGRAVNPADGAWFIFVRER